MRTALGLLVAATLLLPWLVPGALRGAREWPVDGWEGLRGGVEYSNDVVVEVIAEFWHD